MKKYFLSGALSLVLAGGFMAGCTTTIPQGQPLPALSYAHLTPFQLDVARVNVVNEYSPALDPHDMSSGFPSPPDMAVKRYLESRFRPAGVAGQMIFVIEESRIHQREEGTTGGFQNLFGATGKEIYDVMVRLRFYREQDGGQQGAHSIMTFNRKLSIPLAYSLSRKETEKLKFLESFINDVDKALIVAMETKGMFVIDPSGMAQPRDMSPINLLSAPE